jgi:hypothetical protein
VIRTVVPAGRHLRAVDYLDQLDEIPEKFDGWVVTNRVEIIGPALKAD